MDMSKYKPLFLSETGDHLSALETELIALERTPEDRERINEVFRHLHSVKSMSASMGYDPLSLLAHRLEDLVAPHRDRGHPFSSAEIDLLLNGLDALRRGLQAAADDQPQPEPPADLLEAIAAHLGSPVEAGPVAAAVETLPTRETKAPPAMAAAVETPAARETKAPPALTAVGDIRTYRVSVKVSGACKLPSVRAFVAHQKLGELGQIERSEPSVEQLRAGSLKGDKLVVWLGSRSSPADIQARVESLVEIDEVTVESTAAARPGAPQQERADNAPESPTTVRVRTDLLDFFVDSVGELITLRSYFEELAERLDAPALREGVRRMGSVVRRLQDRVMEVRMVPVSLLSGRLPRVCRDIARSRGKQVELVIADEGVELDRAMVEALDNPLLHLVRNAVEHGIEAPEERAALNKKPEGRLSLTVERLGERVLFELADDGRGIDTERVYEKARRLGLVAPDTLLSEQEKLELIFEPGLSTREGADDIAGRGVGLDVVQQTLHSLGGRVAVATKPGSGTVFTLDLPMTMAILQVLLVEIGGHLLALPASRVMRAVAIRSDQIASNESEAVVTLAGQRYPYRALDQLLGIAPERRPETGEIVLMGSQEKPELALGVDRVTGHREAVLKKTGRILRSLGPFNGATVLGDGRPVLIVDVDALLKQAQSGDPAHAPRTPH